jgi:hypothetical protein
MVSARTAGARVSRPSHYVNRSHLDWIRGQDCCVPGCKVRTIHAHHIRTSANSGTALTPPDQWAVPLCFFHHRRLHYVGRETFERVYQVDLNAVMLWCREASGTVMPGGPWNE